MRRRAPLLLTLLILLLAAAAVAVGVALSGGDSPEPAMTSADLPAHEVPAGPDRARCDELLAAGDDAGAFLAGLGAGETGCLRAGVHVLSGVGEIAAPGVTLTSYPGESATLAGRLWIEPTAKRTVIEDLVLDGRNDAGKPSPTVNADDAVLRGNDITNDHQGICVAVSNYADLPPTRGVLIEDNVIHDCGQLPSTNHHHGIYVSHARNTVIRDNLIYGNADRGVQLYPDADDSVVTGNIIDGNGEGVIFGGGPDSSSDDNLVANNVITGSNIRWNIQSNWQGPVGSGNVARDNCVWITSDEFSGTPPGSGIQPAMDGVRASGNVIGDPGYADPDAGDFRIAKHSPCAGTVTGSR